MAVNKTENFNAEVILSATGIVKKFGVVTALNGVSIQIKRGEIRGLIGENGSGKSTLTSIFAGLQKPTSGEMLYKGKPWNPQTMTFAEKNGVCMILQEANTISGCTVAENLFAGKLNRFTKFGFFDANKMNVAAQNVLNNFGLDKIKASDMLDKYSFENRKLLEIVRTVSDDTEVLIVDETTTALSFDARSHLYNIMKTLASSGSAVVFISHDMDEILQQCTHLTVLRDGDIIGHLDSEQMLADGATEKIRYMMVGREIGEAYYREDYDTSHLSDVALEFVNVSVGSIKDFNLKLHKGEIIGFGGLSGCGMRHIGRAAFGVDKLTAGKVIRNGVEIENSFSAIKNGIGYISKDRDSEAIILQASIAENINLPLLNNLQKFTFINPLKERRVANAEIERYRIKCRSKNQLVSTLSGGNKQKVSFAKWTAKDSEVLIMDCPTRGVDIGVKQAMYAMIAQMKKDGKAIIMISEELTELIGMADKIIIMKDCKISGEFARAENLKETDIIASMI